MTAPAMIWLPDALDQLEHAVADSDVVSAGSLGRGHVVAVCSASVLLCSLATPAVRRCPDCHSLVHASAADGRGFLDRLRSRWSAAG